MPITNDDFGLGRRELIHETDVRKYFLPDLTSRILANGINLRRLNDPLAGVEIYDVRNTPQGAAEAATGILCPLGWYVPPRKFSSS